MKVNHVSCGPAVNESERRAFERIRTYLSSMPGDDEWILLTNLDFSATNRRQSDEIDVVVVGPPGVQIIEVKHWTASWINRNLHLVEREADKVTYKSRRIGTKLRQRVRNLPRVDGVFLVTESPPKVSSLVEREAVRGVPFSTLRNIEDAIGFHARPVLTLEQVRECAQMLEPRSKVAVSGSLRRIAGYTDLDLQTPQEDRFHRIYKAKHVSRQDPVVLHLYDLSVDDHTRVEPKAEREWLSLQRLQQYRWAPRIVDSFQDVPGYSGEVKFFTVADPAAPSIFDRVDDNSFDVVARMTFARQSIRALAELHDSGEEGETPVHRNLTSSTILVKHDNAPILTSFEYTRIPTAISVVSPGASSEQNPEDSPEVRTYGRAAADYRSDIYSICSSLLILFSDKAEDLSVSTSGILKLGLHEDPEKRCSLDELEAKLAELLGARKPEAPLPPARFWTEDQVVTFGANNYRIVSRLGSGGVGTTFKVVKIDRESREDLGTYVAKVVRDESVGRRVLRAYELAHSHLRHSALSTIFEVAQEWREDSFVALLTWIEGEPLSEYCGVLPLMSEDLQEESGETLALKWLQTACKALQVLHDNGLVHGDISPRNMIVSGSELVLTDYDCVTKIGRPVTSPGTMLYCSPSHLRALDATPADDLYALAASFFHLLFDREPFVYDGVQAKERGLNWNSAEQQEYHLLAEFMNRATDRDEEKRFSSVADALSTLSREKISNVERESLEPDHVSHPSGESELEAVVAPIARKRNEIEWLKSLLQSYPGSRWGNSETRGLDTDFASKTYIETDLERVLSSDIISREVSLVILCGNAGDGKTALLQRLAKRFDIDVVPSATRILNGKVDSDLTVRMNLDGSASWNGRTADELLDEFLEPFQNGNPRKGIVHLLAINDGRLLEWIENVERNGSETALTRDLNDCLNNSPNNQSSYLRFINLNDRSLVGDIDEEKQTIDTGFLNKLVDAIYGGESASDIWAPCQTCSAQDRCEVFRASQRFGPGTLSNDLVRDRARKRLFEALQAVHLRGETHITIRELRSALVYILFGLHFCSDYHSAGESSDSSISTPYWDRAFSSGSARRQGEVLRELPRFDPALEAHPQVDRRLLHLAFSADVSEAQLINGEQILDSYRRRAYFEWSEEDIESLTGDREALGLANGRHIRKFKQLAIPRKEDQSLTLTENICKGISRLEALPPQALDQIDVVPLRITPRTPTETAFWIEKPLSCFHLEADVPKFTSGIDRLHRQALLTYRYRDGRRETLRLGADLFHLLLELSDGYQLGDVAADDTFAQLSIFVQRLVQEDDRRILTWNPMEEESIFEVSAQIERIDTPVTQQMVIRRLESIERENGY